MLANMKAWLAKLASSPDTEVDLSRRRIVKGAAGLAALAVVASAGGFKLLTSDENSRLREMIKTGVVENQTFYLDRTVVLKDLKGLVIRNCKFVAAPGFIGSCLLHFQSSTHTVVTNCYFDATHVSATNKSVLHLNNVATVECIGIA